MHPAGLEPLTEQEIETTKALLLELTDLMEKEKLFLNTNVSLQKIADRLRTNRIYIPSAINYAFNKNFNAYISLMRINEAIRIIINGKSQNLSMEGIARHSGFSNRNSFSRAFE